MVYSFDIFDTLITRKTGTPKGVFLIIQYKLNFSKPFDLSSKIIENFFDLRIMAEHEAWQKKGSASSLSDYYDILKVNFHLTDLQKEFLMEIELETEKELLILIPENFNKLKKLVEEGEKVILISDMYIPADQMQPILSFLDPLLGNLPLYVSCDFGKTKHDGDLFNYVLKDLNITPSNMVHFGDNFHSDYLKAREVGIISTHYLSHTLPNSIEENYLKSSALNAEKVLSYQIAIGSSQRSRLLKKELSDTFIMGSSFTGPIFYGMVDWLLTDAIKNNIQKLYFCARDGYLLKQIADILVEKRDLQLKTFYLYVSRASTWGMDIALPLTRENLYSLLQERVDPLSSKMKGFFDMLGLNKESLKEEDYIYLDPYPPYLEKESILEILDHLLTNYKSTIEKNLREKQEAFSLYLKQEGLFGDNIALVDTGWRGHAQDIIYHVLNNENSQTRLQGYYYGLLDPYLEKNSPNNLKNSFFSLSHHKDINPFSIPVFIESLLITPFDGCIGYVIEKNKSHPIFKNNSIGKKILEWGWEEYVQGICNFTELMSEEISFFSIRDEEYTTMSRSILYDSLNNPSDLLVKTYGTIPQSIFMNHSDPILLARMFTLSNVIEHAKLSFFKSKKQREWFDYPFFTFWWQGSVKRSDSRIMKLFSLVNILKRIFLFFKNILKGIFLIPKRIVRKTLLIFKN